MTRFLVWIVLVNVLVIPNAFGQYGNRTRPGEQKTFQNPRTPSSGPQARSPQSSGRLNTPNQMSPATRRPNRSVGNTNPGNAPFPSLTQNEQKQLDEVLLRWQQKSQSTKRFECKFKRWQYDSMIAPNGVFSTRAQGIIRYGYPDKGLFEINEIQSYAGIQNGKPSYKENPRLDLEHWECTGKELRKYDSKKKECHIRELPPEMQGSQILESPLPFVFNADAARIKQRYWIRLVPNSQATWFIEAWPKRQIDRAEYRLVRIMISKEDFSLKGLQVYAPNWHKKTANNYDHYEFINPKRNSLVSWFSNGFNRFIPEKPPKGWKVIRERYQRPKQRPPRLPQSARRPPAGIRPIR